MSTDADLVREALDDLNYGHEGDAYAALARLETRIAEQAERLMAYETPGWINSVQKVMEERRRAEVAEARCERLEGALREIADRRTKQWPAPVVAFAEVCEIARAALAEEPHAELTAEEYEALRPSLEQADADLAAGRARPLQEPYADVPGAGQRGCG